ncbi:MAG: transcription termination factor Rho [Lachnospiraceae bacterium]|nr:transcription termination factor Rho [Lachnospiraceae bacterium]
MSLAQLREAAKNSGLKNISTLKKQELQDLLKKESDSVEKAARELEKFAAAEEQKNAGKAKTTAKRGRSKTEESSDDQDDKKAARKEKTGEASGNKPAQEKKAAKTTAEKAAGEDKPVKGTSDRAKAGTGREKASAKLSEEEKKPAEVREEGVTEKKPGSDKKPLIDKKPVQAGKEEKASGKKPAEARKEEQASGNKPAEVRKEEQSSGNKPAEVRKEEQASGNKPAEAGKEEQAARVTDSKPGEMKREERFPDFKVVGNRSQNGQQFQSNQFRPQQGRPAERQRYNNATEGKIYSSAKITSEEREALDPGLSPEIEHLDSGDTKMGILEVMPEGFGFIRCDNFLPGENDVYVSPAQIRKFNLKTGDIISGNTKVRLQTEKFSALLYIKTINGIHPNEAVKRKRFEELTPVFPHERIRLETRGCIPALRIVDLLSPIGKGQRGMIVSQPKAGKTTLLKQIAKAMQTNYPELHIIILLIDERPEEVTDMKESIQGSNVEVIYSTFDELPENHKRVSEMAIERAKRLVEHGRDVVVLLDSITRLARAYNLTCQPSGRTLSGGLDPAALHMPKKFFGAARCMREGGSLTVLATALVETGSRMDDVVFEEFKGTGNMELVLDRNLSERRIFPAIDLPRSSTRREDLLLNKDEIDANNILRRAFNSSKADDVVEKIIGMFARTRTNAEFIDMLKNTRLG